jgi:hypothetical protein
MSSMHSIEIDGDRQQTQVVSRFASTRLGKLAAIALLAFASLVLNVGLYRNLKSENSRFQGIKQSVTDCESRSAPEEAGTLCANAKVRSDADQQAFQSPTQLIISSPHSQFDLSNGEAASVVQKAVKPTSAGVTRTPVTMLRSGCVRDSNGEINYSSVNVPLMMF